MNIELTNREALLIVSALGVFQNRVGQRGSWQQRKRMKTLRSQLADCITIGDEREADVQRRLIRKSERVTAHYIALGRETNTLKDRIKAAAGIGDERITSAEE